MEANLYGKKVNKFWFLRNCYISTVYSKKNIAHNSGQNWLFDLYFPASAQLEPQLNMSSGRKASIVVQVIKYTIYLSIKNQTKRENQLKLFIGL